MRPEQLAEYYPKLFHMAWCGSSKSIRKHGLLSTQSLVKLYGLSENESKTILKQHRPHWFEISTPGFQTATIRDQKPMTENGVRRALDGGEPHEWYELLNSMVFLWPTIERLRTMMSAKAYTGMSHDLLTIDTEKLVERHQNNIRLSRMNSGNTKPFPNYRDLQLFKKFKDYPFDARLKSYGKAMAIAEVCVIDKISDIDKFTDIQTVTLEDLDTLFDS